MRQQLACVRQATWLRGGDAVEKAMNNGEVEQHLEKSLKHQAEHDATARETIPLEEPVDFLSVSARACAVQEPDGDKDALLALQDDDEQPVPPARGAPAARR